MKAGYVFDISEIPKQEDCQIGIVVSLDKPHKQLHCGVAYDLLNSLHILHLKTHKKPKHDTDWGDFTCWVKPNLNPFEQELLLPYFEAISECIEEGHHNIPYGFRYMEYANIDRQGQLTLGEHSSGLTCATYVLTLFHSNSFDFVDIDNWPSRQEDMAWYSGIIGLFARFASYLGFSGKNLARLQEEMGCPRFRPEEAAVSAALYDNAPAPTDTIWSEGKELKEYLFEKAKQS